MPDKNNKYKKAKVYKIKNNTGHEKQNEFEQSCTAQFRFTLFSASKVKTD